MIFLGLALALGVVHLFLGIAVSFKEKVRRGRLLDGVLDDVSWMIVIIGALILVAPAAQGFILGTGGSTGGALAGASFSPTELGALWFSLSPWQRLGAVLFLGGLGVLFLFKGRKSKSWGIRLAKGGFELYGLLQLFGDVLSYSRLLALGLATTVIATVVNTIAAMMGGTPVVGPVLMVLVLVAGHFANLVINCLSGFIHTARLQFVEFFGKFYQGGGHAFTPLSRQGKYVKIMS